LSYEDHTNSDLFGLSPSRGSPHNEIVIPPSNMTRSSDITAENMLQNEGGASTSPGLLKLHQKHKVSESIEETKEENNVNLKDKRTRKISKDTAVISGLIYMKLSSSVNWNRYFARIFNSTIYLYTSIMANRPSHLIFLYNCEIKLRKSSPTDYIELYHTYDIEKFYITSSLNGEKSQDYLSLDTWFKFLNSARKDTTGLDPIDENYAPMGKFQLVISEAINLRKTSPKDLYYVRIQHNPFTLTTGTTLTDNDKIQWKQSFFIPIYDPFFSIKLEIVCLHNSGWIVETKSEEVICTGEVLIADIMSVNPERILNINLPLSYVEPAKKQETQNGDSKEPPPPAELKIIIKNLSNIARFIHPPSRDYIEGVKFDSEKFSKQTLKLGISRLKRIFTACGFFIQDIENIFRGKYQLFSLLCLLIVTHLILSHDASNVLALFFIWLTLLIIYKNPKIEARIKGYMDLYLFSEQHLNPNYHHPMVQTLEEGIDKQDMDTEKWKYKLVDDDPILYQLQLAKKSIIVFTVILHRVTGFFEKLKNIILWHDPIKTLLFLVLSSLAYCAASVMPFRFLFLFIIWFNFIEGISYYKRRNIHNLELTKRVVDFLLKKYFANHHQQIFENLSAPWPTIPNFEAFQKKMIKELGSRLQINLADDAFLTFNTPEMLISAISTCSKILKFKNERNEEPIIISEKEVTVVDWLWRIVDFIMNVPSDYYRVIHPRRYDPHTSWRKNDKDNETDTTLQKSKSRDFELTLIILFITVYEIYLLFNFYILNLQDL